MTRRLDLALALGAAAVCAARPATAAKEDFGGGTVVYAKGTSLWRTDPKGKGPETELVALPGKADEVRMVRSSPDGTRLLIDLGGTWWWATLDPAATAPVTPTQLACGAGPARFAADGSCVVCAGADGGTMLVSVKTGKRSTKPVPPEGARVIERDGVRRLLWADADGVWSAPIKHLDDKTQLAPEGPVRGFLAAPDGSRGVAIYPGHVYEKKTKVDADVLDTFALDGKAARRLLFRDGTMIDWSWDSTWILLQHGEEACIARAVGGEYKCWKGYTALSISPDGKWGLVLGPRPTDKDKAAPQEAEGEVREGGEADGAEAADDAAASPVDTGLPARPFSLFRVRLEGAYTEKPSLVETVADGAAVWLPAATE